MFHAQFHSHYWQKSIHANVYINPTLFTPWRLLLSCSMYQFLLHLHHFLALKWGQDRITNSCKTLQHHHILQGDIFLTLGAQKGICLRTQLLNNPKHMVSTQVLHSKKWKHVFWGCWEVVHVLRQIPFCYPKVRKKTLWRMWWCCESRDFVGFLGWRLR